MTAKAAFEFLERPLARASRASDYSYFHAWRGKKLPHVPAP
jgi:hypothetical protein